MQSLQKPVPAHQVYLFHLLVHLHYSSRYIGYDTLMAFTRSDSRYLELLKPRTRQSSQFRATRLSYMVCPYVSRRHFSKPLLTGFSLKTFRILTSTHFFLVNTPNRPYFLLNSVIRSPITHGLAGCWPDHDQIWSELFCSFLSSPDTSPLPGLYGYRHCDHHGFTDGQSRIFSFGTGNDYISTAARCGKRIIVEVNKYMPRVFGDSQIHLSDVDGIVEYDTPLLELQIPEKSRKMRLSDEWLQIWFQTERPFSLVSADFKRGCRFPSGSYGSWYPYRTLHRRNGGSYWHGCCHRKEKTMHKEKHVFTTAAGTRRMYEFMDDNPP